MKYDFIIVGKKNSDCYVIKDLREDTGGMCCVSKYTLTQLLEKHTICGVNTGYTGKTLGVADITIMKMDGTPATTNQEFPSVKDTKRSAVTVEKGLKLSRAEKAAKNEAIKKRQQALKVQAKERKAQKEAEAKAQKELAKKKAKYQKLVEKAKKKPMRSKAIIRVNKIELVAGEYHYRDHEIQADAILYTPAAVTNFMHICREIPFMCSTASARELNEMIRRSGKAIINVSFDGDYIDELFFENKAQVVYAREIAFSFANDYEDYSFYATFRAPDFKWTFNGRHCTEEDVKRGFGTTAGSEETLNGYRADFLRRGYLAL